MKKHPLQGSLESDIAYQAMLAFLEAHYRRTGSDDIGSLLGDLSLLPDGSPADAAVSGDWAQATEAARQKVDSAAKGRQFQ